MRHLRHLGPEEVAELNALGEVVHFVTVLPIDPHVFDTDVALVAGFLHRTKDASVVDGILRERNLQTAFARAAGMEVGRVRDERFGSAIGQTGAGEVSIVERQSQAGHPAHKPQGCFRIGNERTDVGFDAEDEAMLLRVTTALGGEFIEPIKTTVVQNMRAMTTWCLRK